MIIVINHADLTDSDIHEAFVVTFDIVDVAGSLKRTVTAFDVGY